MEIMEDNYSMSGHFMSFFAKEFIKHEILVQIYIFGNKEFPLYEKHEAHKKLALTTGLNDYNVELLVACTGLCSTLNLRLSHIVRQCLNIGWPLERALFLAPHWLRTIESKLHLLQYVIQNETSESVSMTQTLKVFHFNAQLVAIARSAVKAGKSFYSKDIFDSFSVAYDTKMVKILSLWKRMCTNVKKNITAKAETGDHPCNSYKVDWLIADFLLLYDKSFRVVTSNSLLRAEELKCLVILFKLVVKHNIETLIQNRNPALVQAWMNLYMNYPSSGEISLVLLQRRWYDLKMEARYQVLQYWRGETVIQPHPLLLAIVSNFRYIVLEPYPKWSHLVNYGLIVEFKDITKEVCDRAINDFDGDDDDRTLCVCKYNPKPSLKSYSKLPIISENTALQLNTSPTDVSNVRNNSINTNIGTNSNLDDSLEYRNRLMKDDRNIHETEAQENAGKVDRSMSPCLVIHIDLDSDSSHENSTSRNLRQKPDIYKDAHTSSEMINKEVISERREVKNNLLHAKTTDTFDVNNKVGVTAEKSTSTDTEENLELLNQNARKLLMQTTVPLVRCDDTPSWKRYYRNKTVNIHRLNRNEFNPFKSSPKSIIESYKYSPEVLRKNPDFNLKLKGLSKSFLRRSCNQRLLSLCKPLIVVFDRLGEPPKPSSDPPSADPAPPARKVKKVELPDIDEIRKINSTILTAEVAPVAVQSTPPALPMTNITSLPLDKTTHVSNQKTKDINCQNVMGTCEDVTNVKCSKLDAVLNTLWSCVDKNASQNRSFVNFEVPGCRCWIPREVNNDYLDNNYIKKYNKQTVRQEKFINRMILYLIQNEIHQVPTSTLNDKDKIAESNVEQPEKDGQENILSIDVNPEHKEDGSDHITKGNEISNKEDESKSISSDVEDDIKLSTVVNMVEKKTKRKLNNEEKQNNEPPVKTRKRRRRKKIRERRQSEKIGECLNEYDEWMRQKNLPLKYFTISNLSKSNNNCASSKMKNATECRNVSEVSQLSKSNNAPKDKCPKVLKAFYKNSNPAHYHQAVLSNLVHKIPDNKGVKYYLMNNANKNTVYTAVEVQSEADVADITEAVHDREQEKTVIDPEDINRKTIDDVDLQSENGLMVNLKQSQNRNDFNCKEKPSNIEFLPIITSVCSLAETELMEETAAEDNELLTESLESEIIPPTLSVQSKPNNQSNVSISTSNLSEPILVEHVENESKDKTNVDKETSSGIIAALLNQPPLIGQNNSTSSNRNSQSNATSLKFIQIKAIKTNNGFYLALTPQPQKDQPVLPKHEKPLMSTVPTLVPLNTANVPVTVLQKVCTQPATLLLEKKDKVVTKTPCVQVKAWVETRSTENLMILRMDVSQPLFTEKCEYSLITESNLPCKAPTYWSVNHMESRKRILFPSENKGVDVYNPTTVKVYESAANGSTPFANWVKSILRSAKEAEAKDNKIAVNLEDNKNLNVVNDGTESYEPGDTLETVNVRTGEDEAPNLTLKVKSFARINNEDEEMKAPERVSLNGKLYQKVYDQPLKYAQVFTVVSSLEDAQRLSQMNSQFFVLFNGTSESSETVPSPIDNWQQALVPPQGGQVAGRSCTRAAQELSS